MSYGPWIAHNGGECPVSPETVVQVHLYGLEDDAISEPDAAEAYDWSWRFCADIIRYRVWTEPKRETVRSAIFIGEVTNKPTNSAFATAVLDFADGVPQFPGRLEAPDA